VIFSILCFVLSTFDVTNIVLRKTAISIDCCTFHDKNGIAV
jgi:hypothetical protein